VQARSRNTILPSSQQISDDGKFALLELVAQDRSAFQAILELEQRLVGVELRWRV
jgi:hypothetical protein